MFDPMSFHCSAVFSRRAKTSSNAYTAALKEPAENLGRFYLPFWLLYNKAVSYALFSFLP